MLIPLPRHGRPGRPGGFVWPHRWRLAATFGYVPTRRQLIAEHVAVALERGPDLTLDQLARRRGTDAGDPDVWAAFGFDQGVARR